MFSEENDINKISWENRTVGSEKKTDGTWPSDKIFLSLSYKSAEWMTTITEQWMKPNWVKYFKTVIKMYSRIYEWL